MKAKTSHDYIECALLKNITWIGKEPLSVIRYTKWKCNKCGHEWEIGFYSIKKGAGCPVCNNRKKTEKDYRDLAKEKGFEWIGEMPVDTQHHTLWRCSKGHTWNSCYSNIRRKDGCPHCVDLRTVTEKDYAQMAESRGFKWVGVFPKHTLAKTTWECSNGHQWQAIYTAIGQGNGCPHCSGKIKKTEADYYFLANERELTWLGPFPKSTSTKTRWLCSKGHEWFTTYVLISRGAECPMCQGSNGEQKIARALESKDISYIHQAIFSTCKDISYLRFDFYFSYLGKNFVCEYHGEQHFRSLGDNYFGGIDELRRRQRRDKIKHDWATANGYIYIMVPYTEYRRAGEYFLQLLELHVDD